MLYAVKTVLHLIQNSWIKRCVKELIQGSTVSKRAIRRSLFLLPSPISWGNSGGVVCVGSFVHKRNGLLYALWCIKTVNSAPWPEQIRYHACCSCLALHTAIHISCSSYRIAVEERNWNRNPDVRKKPACKSVCRTS